MIKLGIECENIEDSKSRWGVGQLTFNLLKEYAGDPELQKKFKLYLYFKKKVPDDEFLKNPAFIKRVIGFPSFNIFYHILMPLRAMMDGLDWMFFPSYMLPPLYLGKSVVMLTEDVYYEYKYGTLPFRYRLAYGLFTNWASIKATKILAISETSKKNVARLYGIKPERIFVSYPGVDGEPRFAKNFEGQQIKDDYLLFVGQMFPRRHARETILAFRKIASEFKELKLIMVGKDKYNPPIIRDLIDVINKELGGERIIYNDYIENREDIEKLYSGARVLVYVSDREAFGLPPVEALVFGIPPIVADNELSHEIFGEYAFYSKNGEVDGIADVMRDVLTNQEKADKIRTSGPEYVRKYNWKSFTAKLLENVKS